MRMREMMIGQLACSRNSVPALRWSSYSNDQEEVYMLSLVDYGTVCKCQFSLDSTTIPICRQGLSFERSPRCDEDKLSPSTRHFF
jgi:hypothetical protein